MRRAGWPGSMRAAMLCAMDQHDISRRRASWLHAMGIETWQRRDQVPTDGHVSIDHGPGSAESVQPSGVPGDLPAGVPGTGEPVGEMGWESLNAAVSSCRLCPLHETRRHTVFGTGDQSASWMFVGEAPGAEEDRQGLPFVGRAGQLLDAMLHALGLARESVYIANVLKCRPPENRDPLGLEVTQCEPYLHRQVELVRPRIIVALGRFAAQSLLRSTDPIARLRGRQHTYADTGIPLLVTYHPAYLLRSPLDKAKAWDDLSMARRLVSRTPS
jgi:uracil-DNA glycosylase